MGYEVERIKSEVVDELLCSICTGVLENPSAIPKCEHLFCRKCITEWITLKEKCPIDNNNVKVGDLRPAPRVVQNMLGRLLISCDFASTGCDHFLRLEELSGHVKECGFNPKLPVICKKSCGMLIPKCELINHDCISELCKTLTQQGKYIIRIEEELKNQKDKVRSQDENMKDLKIEINKLADQLKNAQEKISAIEKLKTNHEQNNDPQNTQKFANMNWVKNLPFARYRSILHCGNTDQLTILRQHLVKHGCPEMILDMFTMCKCAESKSELCEIEKVPKITSAFLNIRKIPDANIILILNADNVHLKDEIIIPWPGYILFAVGVENIANEK